MGTDTKALLRGKIDLFELIECLVDSYRTPRADISINFTTFEDYYQITMLETIPDDFKTLSYGDRMKWRKTHRRILSVFYDCRADYKHITTDETTLLSLGCWGDSVKIMETLLHRYGGWIQKNDCSDDWEVYSFNPWQFNSVGIN